VRSTSEANVHFADNLWKMSENTQVSNSSGNSSSAFSALTAIAVGGIVLGALMVLVSLTTWNDYSQTFQLAPVISLGSGLFGLGALAMLLALTVAAIRAPK
jgi:hypothetical protein